MTATFWKPILLHFPVLSSWFMRISIAMAGKHGLLPQTCWREWDGPVWHENAPIQSKNRIYSYWIHKPLQEMSKNGFIIVEIHNWNWSSDFFQSKCVNSILA